MVHVEDVVRLEVGVAHAALPPHGVPGPADALAVDHAGVHGHALAGHLVLLEELRELDVAAQHHVHEFGEGELAALLLAGGRVVGLLEVVPGIEKVFFCLQFIFQRILF